MPDSEKVIKGLEGIIDYFFNIYRNDTDSYKCAKAQEYSDCAIDAIAILKEQEEQVKQWTKEIAENQLAHAPDELDRENYDYKKGIWDGLQIAWNIISEGR